jgi:Fe2+ or Zn2+ uptake regulation protein
MASAATEAHLLDWEPRPHLYVRCIRCGRLDNIIQPILPLDMSHRIAQPEFTITEVRLTFDGLCEKCN